MDFDSPDVEKDFPGLYASESNKKNQSRDSDYSDEEKTSRKDLLGKKREKRESKKDKGYAALEGESSGEDDETKSPGKGKKSKSTFKLGKDKKEKHNKKDRDSKDKKEEKEKEKVCKKESKEIKKEIKDAEKVKDKKKKKEHKLLKIKDKKKKISDQDVAGEEEKPIFGVPLHIAVERSKSHDGIEIPVIVRECIDYIEEHGLACESIYKISGLKSKVRHLKSQYNNREKVYLYEHEPHIVASLLKQFLRDLPEPILTSELAPKFEEAAALKNEKKRVEALCKLLGELPNCNRMLLSWIFVHMLHVVNLEKRNKMNIQNVSIALSPALHISHHVLQALFAHSDILFKGVEIKKYVPPIELDSSRLSLELPDSPSAIEEELGKQENILNNLHAELNTGVRDQEKEEKLWEIQRVVTQLKRKLRFLRQVQEASNSNVTETQNIPTETQNTNISSDINQQSTIDSSALNTPQNEVTLKDNKTASTVPTTVETISKSPDCVAKSPEKNEISNENSIVNSSQIKQGIQGKGDNKISEVPVISKDESSFGPENSAFKENVKTEVDSPPKEVTETVIPPLPPPEIKVPHLTEEEAHMQLLLQEERMLQIQTEELMLLGDELKRKVFSEKMEIERLKTEIHEYQQLYKYKRYSFDSTENSSSESEDSSDSDEEEHMSTVLEELIRENKLLEAKNSDLTKVIQQERERCLNVKVQLKMLQQADLRGDGNYRTRM